MCISENAYVYSLESNWRGKQKKWVIIGDFYKIGLQTSLTTYVNEFDSCKECV